MTNELSNEIINLLPPELEKAKELINKLLGACSKINVNFL